MFTTSIYNCAQHHNKRMQPDQNARYAFILTADAKRYAAI